VFSKDRNGPMKTINVLAICLLVTIATSGGCRLGNEHRIQGASIKDNNSMSGIDQLPKGVCVRLRKSGGIIPFEREWYFYSDGRIRHPNGEITKLEDKSFQELLNRTKIVALADLATDYPPPIGSADFETVELTVRGPSGLFRIKAADTSDIIPDRLWDFVGDLTEAAKKSLAE
jgi:hypothetical protein